MDEYSIKNTTKEQRIALIRSWQPEDESFDDNSRQRPAARASLARDMVTYFGITSKPGQLERFGRNSTK